MAVTLVWCESLFLSGSLNCKAFIKRLVFGLIKHLALLVPQSKKCLESNAALRGNRQSSFALP